MYIFRELCANELPQHAVRRDQRGVQRRKGRELCPQGFQLAALGLGLEDKLNAVYDALFINKYDGNVYQKNIGEVSFDKSSRAHILRIVGLLSDFTDYTL